MIDLHEANIWSHVIAGALALGCGLAALSTLKGGRTHRRAGQIFVGLGAVVLVTALFGVTLFDGPAPLAAASLAAGYQYLSSLRALHLKSQGPGWVDFGLALAGIAACAFFGLTMGEGDGSWSPTAGYVALAFLGAVIAYDLSRHFWRDAWLRHARALDHGLKMTNVYFGMMSAGFGNSLRDLQPWSQILPTILGMVVLVVLILNYLGRRRTIRSVA